MPLDALLFPVARPEPVYTYDVPLALDREAIVPAVRIWRDGQAVSSGEVTMPQPGRTRPFP